MTNYSGTIPLLKISFSPPIAMQHGKALGADDLAFRIEFTPAELTDSTGNISSGSDEFIDYGSFVVNAGTEKLEMTWSDVTIPQSTSEITARVFAYLKENAATIDTTESESPESTPYGVDDSTVGYSALGEIAQVTVEVLNYDNGASTPYTPPLYQVRRGSEYMEYGATNPTFRSAVQTPQTWPDWQTYLMSKSTGTYAMGTAPYTETEDGIEYIKSTYAGMEGYVVYSNSSNSLAKSWIKSGTMGLYAQLV